MADSTKKISVAAVVKYRGKDAEQNPVYAWRRCNEQGRWLAPAQQGDVSQLFADLQDSTREVCLLLPGDSVITTQKEFSAKERKLLRRLLPYELEEDLTAEVEDLHFAFGAIGDDQACVAYVDNEFIAAQIQLLESHNLEVQQCMPEYLLLPYLQHTWTFRLRTSRDEFSDQHISYLDARYAPQMGFTVDDSLAAIALQAQCQNNNNLPEHLYLIAEDQAQLQQLQSLLPESLTKSMIEQNINYQLLDEWDSFDLHGVNNFNLRQGTLVRRLPFKRWLFEWRSVAAMALIAFVAYVAVSVGQIQQLKSAREQIEAEKMQYARQVIQEGYIQDASRQIQQRLSGYRTTGTATKSVQLLSLVIPIAVADKEIAISELRYTQARDDLSMTLEADSDSAIEAFRSKLAENKLTVDPSTTSARGDKYRAQVTVRLSGS